MNLAGQLDTKNCFKIWLNDCSLKLFICGGCTPGNIKSVSQKCKSQTNAFCCPANFTPVLLIRLRLDLYISIHFLHLFLRLGNLLPLVFQQLKTNYLKNNVFIQQYWFSNGNSTTRYGGHLPVNPAQGGILHNGGGNSTIQLFIIVDFPGSYYHLVECPDIVT